MARGHPDGTVRNYSGVTEAARVTLMRDRKETGMNRLIMAVALAGALALPAAVPAHEGHVHKALGTIASVKATQLDVKTTDGKAVTIVFDAKTPVTRGKDKLDTAALKAGDRISVEYTEGKDKINTAKTIKLGESPAARK